jgi:hypothetical protein
MRDSIRLTLKMHRFELVALTVFTAVIVVAAFWVAARLDALDYGRCLVASGPTPAGCEAIGRQFFAIEQNQAPPIFALIAILPYAAGLLLGGPVVAREVERGTTRLAWSIAPSRLRWFAGQVVPIIVIVFAVAFVTGIAADRLTVARSPGTDLANSFDGFGQRGLLVAVSAVVLAVGAIGLGSLIGRLLPTMILALVLGAIGLTGVAKLHADYTAREAVLVDEAAVGRGDRYIDQFFKLPDGRIASWQDLEQIDPQLVYSDTGPTYPIVALVIPGSRYHEVELREAAILGGIAVVMLVGAAAIVQRRRPG